MEKIFSIEVDREIKLLALNLTILIEILKPCLTIFYQSVLSAFGINCHLLLEIQCLLLILKLI